VLDELAGLTEGHVDKVLGPAMVKTIGGLTFTALLDALGLNGTLYADPRKGRNIPGSWQFAYQHPLAPRMEWNMSDPYRSDQSRRYGGSDQAGIWSWLAPLLTAIGLVVGGLLGFYWGVQHEKEAQSRPPATTGSAPSQQRPAPGTQ
jgi:hypothetical protein